ncbi:MAG TPA: branched-chain amino acid ABC transporter substrate-binding protein, partial [Thermodesulfobacteriota bacterium]
MRAGWGIVALVAALVAAAPGAQAATVKIGVAGPMTGDIAQYGLSVADGARLAVQEWNAANPGTKVELVVGDDQGDPRQAAAVANKFVNEGVVGVVGHVTSACTLAAAPIYHDNRLIQVNPSATNPQVTEQRFWNVFRICGRDDQQGKVAADFVASKGLKRVAIVHDKGSYGQGLAEAFRDALKKDHKIEPVYFGTVTRGDKDFSAVLTAIRRANAEALYFGGYYSEGALLVKQAKDLGLNIRFLGGDGAMDPEFVKIAGAAAAEGSWATFMPDVRRIPSAKATIEAYEKQFGPVGPFSLYGYVATRVLLEGLAQAKDPRAAAQAMRGRTFETPLGTIRFDDKGDV